MTRLGFYMVSFSLLSLACGGAPTRVMKASSTSISESSKGPKGADVEIDEEISDIDHSESGTGQGGADDTVSTPTPTPKAPVPETQIPPKDNPKPETPTKDPVVVDPKPGGDTVADCHKGDAFICEAERLCAEQTNAYRMQSNLAAYKIDKNVAFVSRDWSKQQADRGSIGHEGFPEQRRQAYSAEFKTNVGMSAENVAMFSGGGSDPAAVAKKFTTMWWNSAGHKKNMLGKYKNIGCGIYKKGSSFYATQLFN